MMLGHELFMSLSFRSCPGEHESPRELIISENVRLDQVPDDPGDSQQDDPERDRLGDAHDPAMRTGMPGRLAAAPDVYPALALLLRRRHRAEQTCRSCRAC